MEDWLKKAVYIKLEEYIPKILNSWKIISLHISLNKSQNINFTNETLIYSYLFIRNLRVNYLFGILKNIFVLIF